MLNILYVVGSTWPEDHLEFLNFEWEWIYIYIYIFGVYISIFTNLYEIWAERGFGYIISRPRIVHIKHVYKRACFRILKQGFTAYRGGFIFVADVS